jgi:hypothetical protein
MLIAYPIELEEPNAVCRSNMISKIRMTKQQHLQQTTKSLMMVHCTESLLLIIVYMLYELSFFSQNFTALSEPYYCHLRQQLYAYLPAILLLYVLSLTKTCQLKMLNSSVSLNDICWSGNQY